MILWAAICVPVLSIEASPRFRLFSTYMYANAILQNWIKDLELWWTRSTASGEAAGLSTSGKNMPGWRRRLSTDCRLPIERFRIELTWKIRADSSLYSISLESFYPVPHFRILNSHSLISPCIFPFYINNFIRLIEQQKSNFHVRHRQLWFLNLVLVSELSFEIV